MPVKNEPRVVLVVDWLTGMRGGEKVLEVLCERWPHAQLYSLFHVPGSVSPTIERLGPRTSFLQWLPSVHRYYRFLLPLMPLAVPRQLPACDLVVSLSHCVAKSVAPPEGVRHACYCHTPMRYAWQMRRAYFASSWLGRLQAAATRPALKALRHWDRHTADRVSHFIANGRTVQERIRRCYRRDSVIIHPPADTSFYSPAALEREDYYLIVSAFAPYKRLDLAIRACTQLKRRLVIIGTGQAERALRASAGPTIHFLGWQSDEVIRDHFRRCQALLFPGEEDFGIVPVEAQACGAPVIAFGRGGATETVLPWGGTQPPTGVWFTEQSVDGLVEAMRDFEKHRGDFHPASARQQAVRFGRQRFREEIFTYLDQLMTTAIPPLARAG